MSQIKYTKLKESLNSLSEKTFPQLFLLWGEKYLIEEKLDFIVSKILSKQEREFAYNVLTDENLTIPNLIDEISLFSPFMDKKLVYAKYLDLPKDDLKRLSNFITPGIPKNNYLIISLIKIDKRSAFYKIIKNSGLAVDCSVPDGLNKYDIAEQTQFFRSEMETVLKKENKNIDEKAFIRLIDLTGFDISTFMDNLGKLVSFVGTNPKITLNDVSQMIKRTKIDPVFDFTNAYSDKNIEKTLFFLSSLLNAKFHILQILKALTNHMRKIFAAKCFIESFDDNRKIWVRGQSFNTFNNIVVPEIIKADNSLKELLEQLEESSSDFFLASKSKSNYPEYQIFRKSDNFSLIELKNILIEICELDNKFKSSSTDPNILIKDFIFRTCI